MTKHAESRPAPDKGATATQWWDAASYGGFLDAYGKWMRNAALLQEESMRFARSRIERNVEAATGFAACRTPGDMFAMQSQYASETFGDYLAEGRKVVELLKG